MVFNQHGGLSSCITLRKCAKYGETALKSINQSEFDDNSGTVSISEGKINCLFTCEAQLFYRANIPI